MMKIFYAELSTPPDFCCSGVSYLIVSFDGHLPLLKRLERDLSWSLGMEEGAGEEAYEVEPRVKIDGFKSGDPKARKKFLRKLIDWPEQVEVCLPNGETFTSSGCAETLFWLGRVFDGTFSTEELPGIQERVYDSEDPLCFEFLVETTAVGEFMSLDRLCDAEEKGDGEGGLADLALEMVENRVAIAAGWLQVHPVPLISRGKYGIRVDWKNGSVTEKTSCTECSYSAEYDSLEDAMADAMAGLGDEKGEDVCYSGWSGSAA